MARMLISGKMRYKMQIEQRTAGQNSRTGLPNQAWTTFAETRAELIAGGSSEGIRGAGVEGEATHTLRCRWIPGVTSSMRFKYNARIFNVVGIPIDEDEKHKVLSCSVVEVEA